MLLGTKHAMFLYPPSTFVYGLCFQFRRVDFIEQIAGIDFMLPKAVYYGLVPVLGPSGPLTTELADTMHQLKMIDITVLVPSIIQDLASSKSSLDNLCQMSAVIYGGGPLPSLTGNHIAARTRLYNFMGSSEMGNVPTATTDQEDWEYLKFSPKLGFQMRHHSGNLFELVFIRKPHLERFQAVFSTLPNHQEYSSRDLYIEHPTKPDLWKYNGRVDDIMVLTTGEKINPVDMETLIGAHPEVQSVLVVGQARFQTALLVEAREPSLCSESKKKLVEDIWPTVQEANAQCDSHARISKDLILFTAPEKPFLRAGKGTVQRRLTVDSYEDEINGLYRNFEAFMRPQLPEDAAHRPHHYHEDSPNRALSLREMAQDWLESLICTVTGWTHVEIDANFFTLGMDSLQVLNLVRVMNIEPVAPNPPKTVFTAKIIYTNPTIRMLAEAYATTQQFPRSELQNYESDGRTNASELEKLISTYSWNMPITCRPPVPNLSEPIYVLLTGSTGSLGSYIFENLLQNPNVAHIYCLNRSPDSGKRQRQVNEIRGLSSVWSTNRVTFFQSDLSQEYLGLNIEGYRSLLSKVTHILHNAWEVNFNLPLTSFETHHLVGIRQYIDFSARSAKGASILFISSISSCMNWSLKHDGQVPEHIIDDPSVPSLIGYAQSKYVAERVLSHAAETAGVPVRICRVGQVAGPVGTNAQGACWNKQEWLPSLLASSKHVGKIPRSLGPNETIDWIPVDILGRVLVELLEVPNARVVKMERDAFLEDDAYNEITNDNKETRNPYRLISPDASRENDDNSVTDGVITSNENLLKAANFQHSVASHGVSQSRYSSKSCKALLNSHSDVVEIKIIPIRDDGDDSDARSNVVSETSSTSSCGNDSNQPHALITQDNPARVFHAVNPHRTTWSSLLPVIQEHFGHTLQPVSLQEWVAALGESASNLEDVNTNPAIRLLDFFQGLLSKTQHDQPSFETVETERQSRELAALEAVKPEWMNMWLEQWSF